MPVDRNIDCHDAKYGRMTTFPADTIVGRSIRIYGEWAETEICFLSKLIQKNDTIVDVGGYIGTHTLAFSRFAGDFGRVITFEPQHDSFELLQKNISDNYCANVRLENAAVSDHAGLATAQPIDLGISQNLGGLTVQSSNEVSGASSSRESDPGTPSVFSPVRLTTIDALQLDHCALLKIDVEGMEPQAIRGAGATIARCAPFVFAECNSISSGLETIEELRKFNYNIYIYVSDAFNPDNYYHNVENIFGSAREAAVFAAPPGRELSGDMINASRELLLPVETADDLVFALLQKPQYYDEVLRSSRAAASYAESRPLPESPDATARNFQSALETCESLRREGDAAAAALHQAQIAYDALRRALDAKDEALAAARDAYDAAREELRAKDVALSDARTAYDALRRELDAKEAAQADSRDAYGAIRDEFHAKDAALSEARYAYDALRRDLDAKETAQADARDAYNAIHEEFRAKDAALSEARNAYDALWREFAAKDAALAAAQTAYDALQREFDAKDAALADAQRAYDALRRACVAEGDPSMTKREAGHGSP